MNDKRVKLFLVQGTSRVSLCRPTTAGVTMVIEVGTRREVGS